MKDKLQRLEDGLKSQSDVMKTQERKIAHLQRKLAAANHTHLESLQSLQEELNHHAGSNIRQEEPVSDHKVMLGIVIRDIQQVMKESELREVELKKANDTVARQKSALDILRKLHEETVAKLSLTSKNDQSLRSFKLKYNDLLAEQEKLLSILQNEARTCAEEMNNLKLTNSMMEDNTKELTKQLEEKCTYLNKYKSDRACLLSCVCLLLGCVFTSHDLVQRLRFQKKYLTYSMRDTHTSEDEFIVCPSPHRHFRVVTLVLIAISRLRRQTSYSSRLSKYQDKTTITGRGYPVILGLSRHGSCTGTERDIARWLRSESVMGHVRECMTDLQPVLDQLVATPMVTAGMTTTQPLQSAHRGLIEVIERGFLKLLEKTYLYFEHQCLVI